VVVTNFSASPRPSRPLTPGNHDPWLDVRDALNGFLFGWARYFSYGTHRAAFRGIDYYVVVGEPVCATSLNLVPSREEIAHALIA
jgi:hypothetical protein